MTFLVDTSVWSLALRRDAPPDLPQIRTLRRALEDGDAIVTTGLILQELLQGVLPKQTRAKVAQRFRAIGLIQPTRADHVAAAELRNTCRAVGVQLGTIDALIAQLCLAHGLILLATDRDFEHAARVADVPLWTPSAR